MNDLDTRTLAAMYGGAGGPWGPVMVAFTVLGSGWSVLALLPLLRWPRTRTFAQALAAAIAGQAVFVWAVKAIVGRVRPWIALHLPAPLPWGAGPHDGSFPSGHAAGSFCVAVFLAIALPVLWPDAGGRARGVGAAALASAALVAASRVYLGAHFPSDVIAGAAVGSCFGAAGGLWYAKRAAPTVTGSLGAGLAGPGLERAAKRR